jgi:signal transduction histidine kinase/pSer/pThr/pTyr-binding forkhead associated (FHA) protein
MSQVPTLVLKRSDDDSQEELFEVNNQILVGRSRKCDILLDDCLVSRSHALFQFKESTLFLTDLTSRNGTYVNQERIHELALKPGDQIKIGHSQLTYLTSKTEVNRSFEVIDDAAQSFATPVIKKALTLHTRHRITDSFLAHERRKRFLNESDNTNIGKDIISNYSDNANLSPTIQGHEWFNIIFRINREIQTQVDPQEMALAVSDLLLSVLDGDRCLIALFDKNENLELYSVRNVNDKGRNVPVKISRMVAQQVTEERCALNINDIRQDKRFESSDSLLLSKIRSLLVAPIMIGNRVLGLIEVSRSDTIDAFTEAGLDLISIVGSMLGAALNHTEQIRKQEEYINGLKEAHQQLHNAQQDLIRSQQLAVIGRMASSINHEIGNLLMPLLEYHLAPSDDDDFDLFTPEELAYSCTQIKSLIEDIKYFSKGSDRQPEMIRCELSEQVGKATRFVQIDRNLFPPNGIGHIAIQLIFDDSPSVIMDPLQIGRVIINLLRNSAQALRSDQSENALIQIRVGVKGDCAYIEVDDNGPGIPQDLQDKLFEPFVSSKGEQGLGLGLDISRKIIHNHQGQINFSNKSDRGTIFEILLPLTPTFRAKIENSVPLSMTLSDDLEDTNP